jgi:hypothetical protein
LSCSPVRPASQGIKFGSTQRLETTNLKVIHVPGRENCARAGRPSAASKGGETEPRSGLKAATTGGKLRQGARSQNGLVESSAQIDRRFFMGDGGQRNGHVESSAQVGRRFSRVDEGEVKVVSRPSDDSSGRKATAGNHRKRPGKKGTAMTQKQRTTQPQAAGKCTRPRARGRKLKGAPSWRGGLQQCVQQPRKTRLS